MSIQETYKQTRLLFDQFNGELVGHRPKIPALRTSLITLLGEVEDSFGVDSGISKEEIQSAKINQLQDIYIRITETYFE